MVKDLVCGMDVKEEEGADYFFYKGRKYYFCSKMCKQKFDENPEKYVISEEDKIEDNLEPCECEKNPIKNEEIASV